MKRLVTTLILALSVSSAFAANLKALVLTDIHYIAGQATTDYAESGSPSDTGDDLFTSFAQEVKTVTDSESPDITLILGDLPGHDLSDRISADQSVLTGISPSLPVGKPVFYVTGNNDTFGGNYHSFSQLDVATGDIYSPLQLFDNDIPGWHIENTCVEGETEACFIDNGSYEGHPFYFGYYSAYVDAGRRTRLIALNSVMFLGSDYWVGYSSDDGVTQQQGARLQFDWLSEQLQQAVNNNEHIIIAMHIPSGVNSYSGNFNWLDSYQKNFARLVHRYHDHISLMLSGHTHMNELHFYHHNGVAEVVSMGVPGITPLHGNDPGFSLLTFADSAGDYYLDAKQSKSYRYDPETTEWVGYGDFSLCDSEQANLLTLAQTCAKSDIESWTISHFAQGNAEFEPAQGAEAVEQAIWVGTK